ncbi:hypothetical protein [Stakelama marina]|uniref:Uncharacterized protein n=1 Tax=Stakelama marina TaxID=2826939 RepID=A0A8T4IGS6_9SPHN|nr:hypothetical protein [Stakelama marina]MBR0551469.1 hypothetical protein [Stakelama marina]
MRLVATLCSVAVFAATLSSADARDQSSASPEARQTVQDFGACVADQSPEKSAETLRQDFRSPAYQASLKVLARNNGYCFRKYGKLKSSNLLFAGAIAERLIEKGSQPLNVRFAKAAAGPETPAFSPSDKVAACVVRSAPDRAAALFDTKVATVNESDAIEALAPALHACSRMIAPLNISAAGERAMLATAAFRTLEAGA